MSDKNLVSRKDKLKPKKSTAVAQAAATSVGGALPPPPPPPIDEVEASRAPLMDHLVELRQRLMRILYTLVILFIGAWFITEPVLSFLLTPLGDAALRAGRPPDELFVAQTTAPLEMLFVKLKLAFVMALAVGFPFIAYQVYAFVAPGLYKSERAAVMPFLFVMPLLFAVGASLVYYSVLPTFMDLSFSQELVGTNVKAVYVPKVKEYYRTHHLAADVLRLRLPAADRDRAAGAGRRGQVVHAAQGPQVRPADHLRRCRRRDTARPVQPVHPRHPALRSLRSRHHCRLADRARPEPSRSCRSESRGRRSPPRSRRGRIPSPRRRPSCALRHSPGGRMALPHRPSIQGKPTQQGPSP